MSSYVYAVQMPKVRTSAAVFSSPHSGRIYPRRFLRQTHLGKTAIRSSEDAYVDVLFGSAPNHGVPLIAALIPRSYLDLNRAPNEFDPILHGGFTGEHPTGLARAGLGVVPRVVSGGRRIYSGTLDFTEAERRVMQCHLPYHRRLNRLLEQATRLFGEAILFDCHSMPGETIALRRRRNAAISDVVLGNLHGSSCAPSVIAEAETLFRDEGFSVARNTPFAGAYIARQYGDPAHGRHVLQIEIKRSLYLNERTLRKSPDFKKVQSAIERVVARLARMTTFERREAAE